MNSPYVSFRKDVLFKTGLYGSLATIIIGLFNPVSAIFLVSGIFAGTVNFVLLHEFVQKACNSSCRSTAIVRLLRGSGLRFVIIGLGAVTSAIFSLSGLAFFSVGFILSLLTVVVSR